MNQHEKCRAGATPNYNRFGMAAARRMNWALLPYIATNKMYDWEKRLDVEKKIFTNFMFHFQSKNVLKVLLLNK